MSANEDLLELVGHIVSAHVSNNNVATADLPQLIKSVHDALAGLGTPRPEPVLEKPKGAVSVKKSITPGGLVSMIDGKTYQTLRRHITRHGYTPESYREAFGLPRDYPMTASDYSELRRSMAKTIGLGRKDASTVAEPKVVPEPTPEPVQEMPKAKRGRKAQAARATDAVDAPEATPEPAPEPAPEPFQEAPKAKRGRKAKAAPVVEAVDAPEAAGPSEAAGGSPEEETAPEAPKRRGRPRKVKAEPAQNSFSHAGA
jgi:predicted transcriptional regulator